ncbi:MAG: TetR/AcrR family transcriptional regulator [Ruminococcaceae bacterium]|nr:TetR/AcrR family transcriptional regulator [Oscillospiraceae bacterium]
MPPKARFSQEQIVEEAYQLVREQGFDALSARSLAARLGTSTAPLFTAFQNIEEISLQVTKQAIALYDRYMQEGLKHEIPFKGAGLKYIEFAKDEPELFKLLFMRESTTSQPSHYLPAGFPYETKIVQMVSDSYGIEQKQVKHIYNHLSVYTHGLAVLFAQGQSVFTMEDVSNMLSEIYHALRKE